MDLDADQTERNLALGVPMPEMRQTFENLEKFAEFHIIAIPIPPTTAIAGVALMMNLPAVHAMYVAIITQRPNNVLLGLFFRAPLNNRTMPQPIAIKATTGP